VDGIIPNAPAEPSTQPIVDVIWREKYAWKHPDGRLREETRIDTCARVVDAVYANDPDPDARREAFDALVACDFVPGGRILAGAGTGNRVTLINCYVSGTIEDDLESIMRMNTEASLTLQQGGGIGMDFSTIRPEGAIVKRTGSTASGPVSFMHVWDAMCRTIMSAGHRRGAMMGILRCDHPDVRKFMREKRTPGALVNFNVSVAVTEAFMEAVRSGGTVDLGFHVPPADETKIVEVLEHDGRPWYVYERADARELWDEMLRLTYVYAEPGIVFIDHINQVNNLWYCETIAATNPCVTGDTLVLTAEGSKRIDEMLRDRHWIVGADGRWHEIAPAFRTGEKEVLRLRTAGGAELRLTPDHLVSTPDGDVPARDLRPGARVLSIRSAPAMVGNGGWAPAPVVEDEVVSIEPAGVETVYDLTEPATSHFVAGGIVVHNCGEQPLPPYGDCNLGAVNLANVVLDPFTAEARIDWARLDRLSRIGMRFLDNVLDVTGYPLPQQEQEAKAKRRTGLGITGLANMLQALGLMYGSEEAVETTRRVMERIRDAAYNASADLAAARRAFPLFDAEKYLRGAFVRRLPEAVRDKIRATGIRNAVLLTVAPTGTTSLFAGNVSSGIEPTFGWFYHRNKRNPDGTSTKFAVVDDGLFRWCRAQGIDPQAEDLETLVQRLPAHMRLATTEHLTVEQHIRMQAAVQEFVDSSISKTVNCPTEMGFDEFKSVYDLAHDLGLKGCTTYRYDPTSGRGAVLEIAAKDLAPPKTEPAAGTGSGLLDVPPPPRPTVLEGRTYKLKWSDPTGEAVNVYVTINDHVVGGKHRPFEIFIASSAAEYSEMFSALTLTISAIFRRTGDAGFIADDLSKVRSASGGAWVEGAYRHGIVSLLADTIREHLAWVAGEPVPADASAPALEDAPPARLSGPSCPKCGTPGMQAKEGCLSCEACG
jgi:ribonucleotide reductase alpha subunit